ncbi:putative DNA mismatch repair protein MLH3 [Cercophora samala]|uniref:DNA mismatch repair protein MLH3 n=1 Tax=Cercophora samala TaxID=330535 RepID=A0AA40D934_9PEZI|nr:putative DNA mismatch repair protein MLH3 [Cercophora samala]
MSIQQLPGDVVAQIKSSTIITSLNTAVCGLLRNSLDAASTKINISIDYGRGNCSVEDNGVGIPPSNFREGGGLGQLHYTSKYPPSGSCHGKHGEFLASLGALSLLTITSHHRDYRSHNSLTIHKSNVVARNMPALPEQRIMGFTSGTRVSVRDLFGFMPVRVKQRATEVERLGTTRYFDRLIHEVVALLLAWPDGATVSLQDSIARRTLSLQTSALADVEKHQRQSARDIVLRTPKLLHAASLLEQESPKSWVSIGATAPGITVRGCVSLEPAATKRVQFIALGIQPFLNEGHSNFLYDEVNGVFVNSSFGTIEEVGVDEDGRPQKMAGFTRKELKPRKGVDRWPMFFLQVILDHDMSSMDADDFLDEKRPNLSIIVDLLQVMAYEFLKKHMFRPRSVHAIERLKAGTDSGSNPAVESKPRIATHLPVTRPASRLSVRTKASRQSTTRGSETRSASPFSSWPKTKHAAQPPADLKRTLSSPLVRTSGGTSVKGSLSAVSDGSETFGDTHNPVTDTSGEPMVWIDPATKIKSIIDPRTGFAMKPKLDSNKRPRLDHSRSSTVLRDWKLNPSSRGQSFFLPTEQPIPRLPQESDTLGCEGGEHGCHGLGIIALENSNNGVSTALEGRISKETLRKAEVLNQVDEKFVLVKVSNQIGTVRGATLDDAPLLIIIDQHAADERFRVETLLKEYFVRDQVDGSSLVAATTHLDKKLFFDLSKQEGELLMRFQQHFAYWGVVYEVSNQDQASRATVEVQALPPSILERCRLEPRLLVELLRSEIWKLHENPSKQAGIVSRLPIGDEADHQWFARFHNCPEGIIELINSRACRSNIMFNDVLTKEQCRELVQKLAACAFPFQCAHGRPSMVPLVHLGPSSSLGSLGMAREKKGKRRLLRDIRKWKESVDRSNQS